MTQEEEQLLAVIQGAFADRSMPAGRLIEDGVELGYDSEAQRVDAYFRKHQAVVDHHSHVFVAFTYMNTKASFWLLPLYMKSTITDYNREDFLIDVFFNVLAGSISAHKKSPGDRDVDMRRMATDREAEVVCRFCRWLKLKQDMPAIVDEYSDAAIDVWCGRP